MRTNDHARTTTRERLECSKPRAGLGGGGHQKTPLLHSSLSSSSRTGVETAPRGEGGASVRRERASLEGLGWRRERTERAERRGVRAGGERADRAVRTVRALLRDRADAERAVGERAVGERAVGTRAVAERFRLVAVWARRDRWRVRAEEEDLLSRLSGVRRRAAATISSMISSSGAVTARTSGTDSARRAPRPEAVRLSAAVRRSER